MAPKAALRITYLDGIRNSTKAVIMPNDGYLKFTGDNHGFSKSTAEEIVNSVDPTKIVWIDDILKSNDTDTVRAGDTIYITNAVNASTAVTGNDFVGNNEYVFMRALAALPTGGVINIGSGTYTFSSSVVIPTTLYKFVGYKGSIINVTIGIYAFNTGSTNDTLFDNITFSTTGGVSPGVINSPDGLKLSFINCTFNNASNGALIDYRGPGQLILQDCTIDNQFSQSGKHSILSSYLRADNCTFIGNTNYVQTHWIIVKDGLITNCRISDGYVQINNESINTTIQDCVFTNNPIIGNIGNNTYNLSLISCTLKSPLFNTPLIRIDSIIFDSSDVKIFTKNCHWEKYPTESALIQINAELGSSMNIFINSTGNSGSDFIIKKGSNIIESNVVVEFPISNRNVVELPSALSPPYYIPHNSICFTKDNGFVRWLSSFWDSVTTDKLNISGGTMTGDIIFSGSQQSPNLTGEVTSVGNETTINTFSVLSKQLSSFVSGAGDITAADNILTAFEKTTGNIGLKSNITSPIFTGTAIMPAARVGNTIFINNAPDVPIQPGNADYFNGNNQNVIIRALNALTAGGRVILGSGTYIIGSAITIPDFPYIITGTHGVIIQSGFDGTMFESSAADNITFTDITFNIPEFGTFQRLLTADSNNVAFDRCRIITTKTTNANIINITSGVTFSMTNCVFDSQNSTNTSTLIRIIGSAINISSVHMYGNPNNLQTLILTRNSQQTIVSNCSFRNGIFALYAANKTTYINSSIFIDASIRCQDPVTNPFVELSDCNLSSPTLTDGLGLIYLFSSGLTPTYGISTNNCTWSLGSSPHTIGHIRGTNTATISLNSRNNKGDYVTLSTTGVTIIANIIVEQPLKIIPRNELPLVNMPINSVAQTSDYGSVRWTGTIWLPMYDESNTVNQMVAVNTSAPITTDLTWTVLDDPGQLFTNTETTSTKIMLDCSIVLSTNIPTTVLFRWVRLNVNTNTTNVIGVGNGGNYQATFSVNTSSPSVTDLISFKYVDYPNIIAQFEYSLEYIVDTGVSISFNKPFVPITGAISNAHCISTITLTKL